MSSIARISVIVPTLNEEECIVGCLEHLRREGLDEIIVVDGGSTDATCKRAASLADSIRQEPGGLFAQLNRGAKLASGDVLLFHYADGILPEGARHAIEKALQDPRVGGGAFRLDLDSREIVFRVIALTANWRNRLGVGPFGDQSIFARTESFRELRGFDLGTFFPDQELVRQLRRVGKFRILRDPVVSSIRRWQRQGILKTQLSHWKITVRLLLGGRPRRRGLHNEVRRLREVR